MISEIEIDGLAFQARFGGSSEMKEARATLRRLASERGVFLASIKSLYDARAKGEITGFTVPAMNVRGMAYEFCRAIIRAAMATKTGAFVVEIARSEMEYTDQRPDELAVVLLAAALREGYQGPLFLQGDHYKVNPGPDGSHVHSEVAALEQLIDESLAAGFYNIDIDASATVNVEAVTPAEKQALNAELTAHFTKYIRTHQLVEVAVGGEIGEIGGVTSTVDDLESFMTRYSQEITMGEGIGKVAIQTGTSHGGTPKADGTVAAVQLDLGAIQSLGDLGRSKFGLAGVVQHGASTLPADGFGRFPEVQCLEIHLSTEFQNILFHHPKFPAEVMREMEAYLTATWSTERKAGMTDEQFYYKTRKRAWGPFKRRMAELPENVRAELGAGLEDKVRSLFAQLRVEGTRDIVSRYVA